MIFWITYLNITGYVNKPFIYVLFYCLWQNLAILHYIIIIKRFVNSLESISFEQLIMKKLSAVDRSVRQDVVETSSKMFSNNFSSNTS